jgi:hypothetical protein
LGNPHSFSMSYTHIDHIKRVYFWPSSVFILLSSLSSAPSLTLPPHSSFPQSGPVANKGEQSDTTVVDHWCRVSPCFRVTDPNLRPSFPLVFARKNLKWISALRCRLQCPRPRPCLRPLEPRFGRPSLTIALFSRRWFLEAPLTFCCCCCCCCCCCGGRAQLFGVVVRGCCCVCSGCFHHHHCLVRLLALPMLRKLWKPWKPWKWRGTKNTLGRQNHHKAAFFVRV